MKLKSLSEYTLPVSLLIILSGIFSHAFTAPVNTIKEWKARGALIVDVRTPQEFSAGNIPGSINIPLAEISSRISEFGSRDGYIIVYCRSGNRSGKAKSFLESQGYKNVINGGGLQDMINALK